MSLNYTRRRYVKWPQLQRLIAQLVKHCIGIGEVMGSNPVEDYILLLRLKFHNCLSFVHSCNDQSYLRNRIMAEFSQRTRDHSRGVPVGSLSTDVFEPRTSTGSRDFPSLIRI